MMKNVLLASIIMLCLGACASKKPLTDSTIDGFNAQAWRNDTMSCHSDRMRMLQNLVRDPLFGRTKDEITKYLGKPNMISGDAWVYFTNPQLRCIPAVAIVPSTRDLDVILHFDKKDKVSRIEMP